MKENRPRPPHPFDKTTAEKRPWHVKEIEEATNLPNHTIRKFVRSEELVSAAKRMARDHNPGMSHSLLNLV